MKIINKYIILACLSVFYMSCAEEEAEVSTNTTFPAFTLDGLQDKYVFDEADTTILLPFTLNDNQIYELEIDVVVGSGTTATEDEDFALGSHSITVPTLKKSGAIEFILGSDIFLEGDEKVFLELTSHLPSGLKGTKIIEITIKNVGGCPPYVHNDFVGDYEVVSDAWQDYPVGTTVTVATVGNNILSFNYNCGANAKPILMNVNPNTFGISGIKQEYCSYDLPPLTKFFGDIVETGANASFVNTCTGELNVTIAHTDENNNAYGSGKIVLKKK
ncbi:MAG: hypothetical protein IPN79_07460 [Saprospiraceae bacterium]|nr:hypothetical protein [Saprospiraceae bacterium]